MKNTADRPLHTVTAQKKPYIAPAEAVLHFGHFKMGPPYRKHPVRGSHSVSYRGLAAAVKEGVFLLLHAVMY